MKGWIGVDLDGTLARYDGPCEAAHIGPPIPAMLERVKIWLAEGMEVRIVTARVNPGGSIAQCAAADQAKKAIREWTLQHLGVELLATCEKNYEMVRLWDDRADGVLVNTGELTETYSVRVVLQSLLYDGVDRLKLECAALAAGYELQYVDTAGNTKNGTLRRRRGTKRMARYGADGVIRLHAP